MAETSQEVRCVHLKRVNAALKSSLHAFFGRFHPFYARFSRFAVGC